MSDPQYYQVFGIDQAAEYTGFSTRTLRRAAHGGELDFIQRGPRGKLLFRQSDLDRWLDTLTHRSIQEDQPR